MLLTDLHELTKFGAQKPLAMWWGEYQPKNLDLSDGLSELAKTIEAGTGVRENLEALAKVLKINQPGEYEMAKMILYTAELFKAQTETLSEEDKNTVFSFIVDSKKFCDRAQTAEFLGRERQRIQASLSAEEQTTHDRRLFELEGMMYCLEYYLTLYKAILDAPDEPAKRKFIESSEINFGFGDLPGIWTDFDKDEVLQKFILKILNQDLRSELEVSYYTAKEKIAKIKMICDKQGTCSADYNGVTLEEVINAFKELIKVFIAAFQKVGIEQLSSYFLTPFGKNAKLSEVKI
ncbi:MAG: hypothetical protein UX09_C0028G0009 [Candidatus Uhrbacteria bacterium GW2011_GWE2_45_35]|uniref:Uncharacterized protein n=2 Tax=Candidatus Uhriibacteriota TaxID=1752732 RepID=A0A0G1JA57_9BACT|nr:MAG: hypothetical protein UW63_C0084G0001 [Candidatus Uhrbacteria bacterium GW2011_GWF2_44_350]KKU07529.1 MAG: hypothetical protein UX09_C0028G0009 [Candidatus Uhrbacteria bacterium GW2011_GWE2_45_35]HBR80149.1 hypothetical protein [Candidatus Uhrbacteria bacterium]HCU31338.1 hypothetical protein [Candidatus Uhrbacteria bacterium]